MTMITKVALIGNPNCGKSTLFNTLTGARQRIGNWPGVTVERKSGRLQVGERSIELIDLPGLYSLTTAEDAPVDERIACDFILQQQADLFINIVDASHLERHLYLTIQLLEMGLPVILVLNMADIARARQIHIDVVKLSEVLGCPVVMIEAHKGSGIETLIDCFDDTIQKPSLSLKGIYPAALQQAITQLTAFLSNGCDSAREAHLAMRLLEGDVQAARGVSAEVRELVKVKQADIQQTLHEEADILFADARYRFIQQVTQACVRATPTKQATWTTRIDNIVLHRVFGLPIFLGVMYLLFFFAINIGGAFQDFFDLSSEAIFVNGVASVLTHLGAPNGIIALLANGVGKGINTTITFIPVIGALFLFLAFLEDSGYMARAAFVVDRLMRFLGLPGKAFVPMIVGFGCNVPAVMASRTLENKRDRIITILMTPFMSCGARLAIYAVFTAAFFAHGGQNIVFALYLIGILMAVVTGFILRQTLLTGEPSPLLMELPTYHVPRITSLFLHAWQRLQGFVFRAGKVIIPISVLIGVLNVLHVDGSLGSSDGDVQSFLSVIGKSATTIFAPMGIQSDNWPATVGLVTGVLAKEVVVGTLNTLYTQIGHLPLGSGASFQLIPALKAALQSIPDNFVDLGSAFLNPIAAKAPIHSLDKSVYGVMAQQFDGRAGAFAYLLFVLLYFPCISTMAVMLRELHRGWVFFSAYWTTGVAYAAAVIFYQAATWSRHPYTSSMWISAMLVFFFGTIGIMRWYAGTGRYPTYAIAGELQ